MSLFIPSLDYRDLLPPLLACLPTAFASPQVPPPLLPLLCPILQQRVQLLDHTQPSPNDSWLSLLCWNPDEAKKLVDLLKNNTFELHPVSGEIDFGDIESLEYRRLDEETLQASVRIPELGIIVQYLWCQEDHDAGGNGWRILEITPFANHDETDPIIWFATISEADENVGAKFIEREKWGGSNGSKALLVDENEDRGRNVITADEDDQYWSRYNDIPEKFPDTTQPPALNAESESEYFARYGQVQPEMDGDDPSQDRKELRESTLVGDVLMNSMQQALAFKADTNRSTALDSSHKIQEDDSQISYPRASSPSARSTAVPKLEESAASQSVYEIAIRQHVSTSIKSLFRLARGVGMDRNEFDELVQTELDTLGMMTEDD